MRTRIFICLIATAGLAVTAVASVPTEFQATFNKGYGVAYPIGYRQGVVDGEKRGWEIGTSTGKTQGFDNGWSEAYSPAYDLAYDEVFPLAHLVGWNDGLDAGFVEGLNYVPTIIAAAQQRGGTSWGGFSGSGAITVRSGIMFGSGAYSAEISMWSRRIEVDWTKHYYDEGYNTGFSTGFSAGSDDGYNRIYPIAYRNAYQVAFLEGVGEGTRDGTEDGYNEGFDEGWDEGYDGGFDAGFVAGIDYGLYGDFIEPRYSFAYARRSDASTMQTLIALHAPEPSSFVLLGMVSAAGLIWRRRS